MKLCSARPLAALAAALLTAAAASAASPAAAADDAFYTSLFHRGVAAMDAGESERAAKLLRIASFGFLDEPEPLTQCLVYLGLAQAAAGDREGFRETAARLAEVEQRYHTYEEAPLGSTVREAFAADLRRLLPRELIEGHSGYTPLVAPPSNDPEATAAPLPTEAPTIIPTPTSVPLPSGVPTAAPTVAPQRTPVPSPEPPATPTPSTTPAVIETPTVAATPATVLDPEPSTDPAASVFEAPTPTANVEVEDLLASQPEGASSPTPTAAGDGDSELPLPALEKLLAVYRLLAVGRSRDAAPLVTEVADAYPASTQAQLLAAETMYRLGRWKKSYDYFHRAATLPAERPDLFFYRAVAAYETGHTGEAAAILTHALPHLERTPLVDRYVSEILPSKE